MIKNKKEVSFEQVIAGALLKFRNLDVVDINLIMEKLSSAGFEVLDNCEYSFPSIENYIKIYENGRIELRKGLIISQSIKAVSTTIGELFQSIMGIDLIDFFDNLNLLSFKDEKQNRLLKEKATILSDGKVLVLSGDRNYFEQLKKYGFRNVKSYESFIKADFCLKDGSSSLSDYQIIVVETPNNYEDIKVLELIKCLQNKSGVLVAYVSSEVLEDGKYFSLEYFDKGISKSFCHESRSIFDIVDFMLEGAIAKKVVNSIDITNPFVNEELPKENLPFPSSKDDLRILYLESARVSDYSKGIALELGLNVDFMSDSSDRLKSVMTQLGNYDIVIASEMFSKRLLEEHLECHELCKETGRQVVLLATYNEEGLPIFSEDGEVDDYILGCYVNLNYILSGSTDRASIPSTVGFRVPRVSESDGEFYRWYRECSKANLSAILQIAVRLYNEKFLNGELKDIDDFKTPHEFDVSFLQAFNNEKNRQNNLLEKIRIVDEIKYYAQGFMNLNRDKQNEGSAHGLSISESDLGYRIECGFRGQIMCSLTLSKGEVSSDNLRIFNIRTLSKKNKLNPFKNCGLYSRKFRNLSVPPQVSDEEWGVVLSIYKKIIHYIKPIVDEFQTGEDSLGHRISLNSRR